VPCNYNNNYYYNTKHKNLTMTMTFMRLASLAAVAFSSLQPCIFSGSNGAVVAARFVEHALTLFAVQPTSEQTFNDINTFDSTYLSSPLLVNATELDWAMLNISPDRHEHIGLNPSPSLDDEDKATAPRASSLAKVVERAVIQLRNQIITILGLVLRVINLISSSITEFIDSVVSTVETTIIDIIHSVVSSIKNSVNDMIDSLVSTVSTMIADTVDAVVLSFENFFAQFIALLDFMDYWIAVVTVTSVAIHMLIYPPPTPAACHLKEKPIERPVVRLAQAQPVARPAARPAQAPIPHQGQPIFPLAAAVRPVQAQPVARPVARPAARPAQAPIPHQGQPIFPLAAAVRPSQAQPVAHQGQPQQNLLRADRRTHRNRRNRRTRRSTEETEALILRLAAEYAAASASTAAAAAA
jgi:hypothetical protein